MTRDKASRKLFESISIREFYACFMNSNFSRHPQDYFWTHLRVTAIRTTPWHASYFVPPRMVSDAQAINLDLLLKVHPYFRFGNKEILQDLICKQKTISSLVIFIYPKNLKQNWNKINEIFRKNSLFQMTFQKTLTCLKKVKKHY